MLNDPCNKFQSLFHDFSFAYLTSVLSLSTERGGAEDKTNEDWQEAVAIHVVVFTCFVGE